MTNLVYLLTIVVTNWVTVPGDHKTEGGTNYFRQVSQVSTNTYIEEVMLCTNRTMYHVDGQSNGPLRWQPVGAPMPLPPPLPLTGLPVRLRRE